MLRNIQINHYDTEGLRHEMKENGKLVQFIFRGTEVVAEESQESRIRDIRTGELLASDAECARTYYHYASDEMGSITHVTAGVAKEEGEEEEEPPGVKILNQYEYDAWGNVTACEETVENRFRFNGQQYDPVAQQYYLRARFYNPVIGRFTQEDTYRGDGLNLYTYCRNNPVYYVDPSGHICDPEANRIRQRIANGTATAGERRKLEAYERNNVRKQSGADKSSGSVGNGSKNLEGGRQTDFYVTPDGTIIPANKAKTNSQYDRLAVETYSGKSVHPNNAVDDWNSFLGPNQTDINPFTGQSSPDRIWSADGTRSIRFGDHEMDGMGTKNFHSP